MTDQKPPERIYLQADSQGGYQIGRDATWCDHRIHDEDVEYVLASEPKSVYLTAEQTGQPDAPESASVGDGFLTSLIQRCDEGHDYEVRVTREGTAGWVVNLYPVGGDEAATGDPGFSDKQNADDMASSVRLGLATKPPESVEPEHPGYSWTKWMLVVHKDGADSVFTKHDIHETEAEALRAREGPDDVVVPLVIPITAPIGKGPTWGASTRAQRMETRDSQMRAMIDQACEDLGRHGLQPTDEAAQVVLNLIVSASELGRLVDHSTEDKT